MACVGVQPPLAAKAPSPGSAEGVSKPQLVPGNSKLPSPSVTPPAQPPPTTSVFCKVIVPGCVLLFSTLSPLVADDVLALKVTLVRVALPLSTRSPPPP